MSTIEDFENAPVGATATHPLGSWVRVMKTDNGEESWITPNGSYFSDELIERRGYTLDQSAPTSARDALDIAWGLAHEVKEGQVIPAGTEIISVRSEIERAYGTTLVDQVADGFDELHTRTLDPLTELEPELPDWLDADAVVATKDAVVDVWTHCIRHPHDGGSGWTRRDPDSCTHWTELEHVTPLYPKGQDS